MRTFYDRMVDKYRDRLDRVGIDGLPRLAQGMYQQFVGNTDLSKSPKVASDLMREFRLYYEKFPRPEDTEMNDTFKMIMMTLRNGEENRELLNEFFKENDIMDKMRGEDLGEITPKLLEVREWIEKN